MANRARVSRFPVTMSTDTSENALHQAMTSALVKTSVDKQDVFFEVVLFILFPMLLCCSMTETRRETHWIVTTTNLFNPPS